MKKRNSNVAIIYARFSPRRNPDDCESCETQIDYCSKYCNFHKLDVLGVHRDDGMSGAVAGNRPGLQEAIEQAIKNKAVLVFYSLSRLARNTRETIEIADRLHKAKANLCSVTEKIDTSTAMGAAFFQIIAVLAELERGQVSERTSDAMRRHQASGRRMSHRLPFGWKADPDDPARMLPDDIERIIIGNIEKLRARGLSYRKIAKVLEGTGYKPRPKIKKFKGKNVECKGKWHHGLIRAVLERLASGGY